MYGTGTIVESPTGLEMLNSVIISEIKMKVSDHLPYRLDLIRIDYHLFIKLRLIFKKHYLFFEQ